MNIIDNVILYGVEMNFGEAKTLKKTIHSTCSIKEENIIVAREDLPTPIPNYELHLLDVTFDEGLCVYKQFVIK